MPNAPDHLREEWGIDDGKAYNYLISQGYVLTEDFGWLKPKDHTPTEKELSALDFLCLEWDWAGVIGEIE